MRFEWDDEKDRENRRKHGIGFARASRIFEGFVLSRLDDRFAYAEERFVSIGQIVEVETVVLVLVHTDRGGTTRIISARRASRAERRNYEAALQERANR